MALTVTDRGASSRNTGGESTIVVTPASNLAVGSRAVLFCAYDNSGTLGADPYAASGTIIDSVGNSWATTAAQNRDPGAANAGISLRQFEAVLTVALTTSDTITVSLSGITTVARAWALIEIAPPAGYTADPITGTSTGANGASTTPSVTSASLSTDDVLVGGMGAAGNATITADSDTTRGTWSTQQTSGVGVGAAGAEISSQYKTITSAGTQTYNQTITSADWANLVRAYHQSLIVVAATGTGAANLAAANVQPNAGSGAGTGLANSATGIVSTGGVATATGSGAGNFAAGSVASSGGVASGTGTANTATESVSAGGAGTATGTGSGNSAVGSVAGSGGTASGTGSTGDPTPSLAVNGGIAAGTGSAYGPSISDADTAEVATGTGTANNPAPAIAASVGVATGLGAAYDATVITQTSVVPPSQQHGGGGHRHRSVGWERDDADLLLLV